MKQVAITGASSFIGRRLCRKMSERGWYVHAIVRENFTQETLFQGIDNLNILYCNMENYACFSKKADFSKLSCAILLAWNGTRGDARNDRQRQQKNAENTEELAKYFVGNGCQTIVLAGSQAEYGPNSGTKKINEDFPCMPNTEYGKAKLHLFTRLKEYCNNKHVRIIEPRFFSLYGEGDFEGTMIISMLRNMLSNDVCNLTECRQIWNFMYIDDAVEVLCRLIENPAAEGIFNFGTSESKPLREYVEVMKKITKSMSKINYGAVPYPPTGIVHTNPSVEKLHSFAGYVSETDFETGIKKILLQERDRLCQA